MCKKHKKVCRVLNYIEHALVLISAITGCVSISAFASLVGIPIGIMSSATGLIICAITTGIKKYKKKNMIWKKKPKTLIINRSLNYIKNHAVLLFEV